MIPGQHLRHEFHIHFPGSIHVWSSISTRAVTDPTQYVCVSNHVSSRIKHALHMHASLQVVVILYILLSSAA